MATLRDIKRRIKAVQSTRQITKAMKMVAAAKLRKSQERMFNMRPYAEKMQSVISSLASGVSVEENPLLVRRPPQNVDVLVITSDRGLCGAFNANVLRAAEARMRELSTEDTDAITITGGPVQVGLCAIGKKAQDYFRRRSVELTHCWTGFSGKINYHNAQIVAHNVIERYTNGDIDAVYIIYNRFKSVGVQEVTVSQLLPVETPEPEEGAETFPADYIFEPSEQELFERLLPKSVEIQLYSALLESQTSEEAARMTAMENATQSANEMIDTLTLQYNKARQASITAELMDIVGGVEALKQS